MTVPVEASDRRALPARRRPRPPRRRHPERDVASPTSAEPSSSGTCHPGDPLIVLHSCAGGAFRSRVLSEGGLRFRAWPPALISLYRCSECSAESVKWLGRCVSCQAWGTVEEVTVAPRARRRLRARRCRPGRAPVVLPRCRSPRFRPGGANRWPSGLSEFDRVLGGGLVPGRSCCWPASPGWASPPCCSQWPPGRPAAGARVLVVTGEETAAQVQSRAARIGALEQSLYLAAETDLGALVTHVEQVQPSLLIVDSVQTIAASRGRRRARRRHPGARGRQRVGRRSPSRAASPPCWSATSRRTAPLPARAPSSTWSTSCCRSRASGPRRCAWCGR